MVQTLERWIRSDILPCNKLPDYSKQTVCSAGTPLSYVQGQTHSLTAYSIGILVIFVLRIGETIPRKFPGGGLTC